MEATGVTRITYVNFVFHFHDVELRRTHNVARSLSGCLSGTSSRATRPCIETMNPSSRNQRCMVALGALFHYRLRDEMARTRFICALQCLRTMQSYSEPIYTVSQKVLTF